MIDTKWADPDQIAEPHEVRDEAKLAALIASMSENDWQGRPLLAWTDGTYIMALTGSHRIAAAREVGIAVPVYTISQEQIEEYCQAEEIEIWELTDYNQTDSDLERMLQDMGDEEALALLRQEENLRS